MEVEFLAPKEVKLKKHKPKLLADFRVFRVEAASEAFRIQIGELIRSTNVFQTKSGEDS